MIQILYFARIKDRLKQSGEELDYQGDLAGLVELLRARGGIWAEVFAEDQPVLMALNQEMARAQDQVSAGDEVGFFPPVTGG